MENFIFCLQATMPIFLLMVLGFAFRQTGLIDAPFAEKLNQFVFKAALPVLLFKDMAGSDFSTAWDGTFLLFCLLVTAVSILIAALLGVALMENLYGGAASAPLMILSAVPLYNIAAVLVLTATGPGIGKSDTSLLKRTAKGVVTNPIILGIAAGFLWSLLRIPQPPIFQKTVSSLAALATPLGLMSMGASFRVKQAAPTLKSALACTALKLLVFPALFLPLAVRLGFTQDKLVAILVMLGASTTVSCFVMARNLGHEGSLTSNTVMLTTLLSAFTLTVWLFLLRGVALI